MRRDTARKYLGNNINRLTDVSSTVIFFPLSFLCVSLRITVRIYFGKSWFSQMEPLGVARGGRALFHVTIMEELLASQLAKCTLARLTTTQPPPCLAMILPASDFVKAVKETGRCDDSTVFYSPDQDVAILVPSSFEQWLEEDPVSSLRYMKQTLDCDDFAAVTQCRAKLWWAYHRMKSSDSRPCTLAIAVVVYSYVDADGKRHGHAINAVLHWNWVKREPRLAFYEPQTDKEKTLPANARIHHVLM